MSPLRPCKINPPSPLYCSLPSPGPLSHFLTPYTYLLQPLGLYICWFLFLVLDVLITCLYDFLFHFLQIRKFIIFFVEFFQRYLFKFLITSAILSTLHCHVFLITSISFFSLILFYF